jgi:hypothetical protein
MLIRRCVNNWHFKLIEVVEWGYNSCCCVDFQISKCTYKKGGQTCFCKVFKIRIWWMSFFLNLSTWYRQCLLNNDYWADEIFIPVCDILLITPYTFEHVIYFITYIGDKSRDSLQYPYPPLRIICLELNIIKVTYLIQLLF